MYTREPYLSACQVSLCHHHTRDEYVVTAITKCPFVNPAISLGAMPVSEIDYIGEAGECFVQWQKKLVRHTRLFAPSHCLSPEVH